MATFCSKCGKDVDTLAKRIHRCGKSRIRQSSLSVEDKSEQTVLGYFRGRGFGPRPYLRKRRKE